LSHQHCCWIVALTAAAIAAAAAAGDWLYVQLPDRIHSLEAAVGHISRLQAWVCCASESLAAPIAGQADIITRLLTGKQDLRSGHCLERPQGRACLRKYIRIPCSVLRPSRSRFWRRMPFSQGVVELFVRLGRFATAMDLLEMHVFYSSTDCSRGSVKHILVHPAFALRTATQLAISQDLCCPSRPPTLDVSSVLLLMQIFPPTAMLPWAC
jgi:hypothetical protein